MNEFQHAEVGDQWEITNALGNKGKIWLDERLSGLDVWKWWYDGGNTGSPLSGWAPTYRGAIKKLRVYIGPEAKFKKVEETRK